MNRAGCQDCGDVIVSRHRHDYVSCKCGKISVDGGDAYHKRSFTDKLPVELPHAVDVLAFHMGRQKHPSCGTDACCRAC